MMKLIVHCIKISPEFELGALNPTHGVGLIITLQNVTFCSIITQK